MENLSAFVWLTVIGTTIWVGFDASANKVTSDGKVYKWSNGATAWVVGCILLWIIFFPYYLVCRSRTLRGPSIAPQVYYNPQQWPPAPQQPASLTVEIERLSILHRQGALSDDEFLLAKKRLLEKG